MADGGSITVVYKADASPLQRATEQAKRYVKQAGNDMAQFGNAALGTNLARSASAMAVVGIAANRLGANLQDLGDKYSAAGRAGGFLTNITQGNLIGAIKAAGQATQLSGKQVDSLTSAWFKNTSEVERAIKAYQSIGAISEETADKIRRARAEIAAGFAIAEVTFGSLTGSQANFPDNRATKGPGARVFETPAPKPAPVFGLPVRNQVALEAARASGDRVALIKQIQRAESLLSKQLQNEKLTDRDRLGIYSTITALNSELTSLTKKTAEQKKKQVKAERDQAAALQFTTVNSNLAGSLGAGPFLTSPVFQYAQQFGFKARPQDFLKDLRLQVRDAAGFDRNLTKLGKFGASTNLVGELAGMGQQGQDIAAALAKQPGLVKQYSRLADKRAAIAEKLQVQSMRVVAASVVVQGNRIVGVDRNGNNQLEKAERFTVLNGGTVKRGGERMGGV